MNPMPNCDMRVMCLGSIAILLLLATSGYLFFEEQRLEKQISYITKESAINCGY